jgi:hypothetical protein
VYVLRRLAGHESLHLRIHLMVFLPSMLYLLWASAASTIQEFPSFTSRIYLIVFLPSMLYLLNIKIYFQRVGRGDGESHYAVVPSLALVVWDSFLPLSEGTSAGAEVL